MLVRNSVVNSFPIYDGNQTVNGIDSTTITATTAGFRMAHATNARADILFSSGLNYRQFPWVVVVYRAINRNNAQYWQLRMGKSPTVTTDDLFDRVDDNVLNILLNYPDMDNSEWITAVYPTTSFNSPAQMSAAEASKVRSFRISMESGVRTGPVDFEVKSITLAQFRPIVCLGTDDAFAGDYSVIYQGIQESGITSIPFYHAIPTRAIQMGTGPGAGGYLTGSGAVALSLAQMQEMAQSGVHQFVNHTHQHASLANDIPDNLTTVAEPQTLTTTPTDQPSSYGGGSFAFSACTEGGSISAGQRAAVEYEINTARTLLQGWGLDTNNSASILVSPYGRYNSDVIRIAKDNGFIAHRTADPEVSRNFDIPGSSPYLMKGRLGLNLASLDARIQEGIMRGSGMFSPFGHGTAAAEKEPFKMLLRKWDAQQKAGLVRFVSATEYVSLMNTVGGVVL